MGDYYRSGYDGGSSYDSSYSHWYPHTEGYPYYDFDPYGAYGRSGAYGRRAWGHGYTPDVGLDGIGEPLRTYIERRKQAVRDRIAKSSPAVPPVDLKRMGALRSDRPSGVPGSEACDPAEGEPDDLTPSELALLALAAVGAVVVTRTGWRIGSKLLSLLA